MIWPVRVGIATGQNQRWETMVERWRLYEELGFDSLWDFDHFTQPSQPEAPFYDGWTLLAALAASTQRVRLGVLVTCNTFRHPSLVAKIAVTVDHVSRGRLDLGLGAGNYEPEHRMFGLDFPPTGERVTRFGEAVELLDLLLRNDVTTWSGRHYRVEEATFRPRPIQLPRPPFVIGAKKPRMLRICALHGDVWNAGVSSAAEVAEMSELLAEQCFAVGRDSGEIRHSVYYMTSRLQPDPWSSADAFEDVLGRYREAGIDEFIVDPASNEQLAVMERVAGDLLPKLRAG
ncbi:MAG TPA: LLM class flavin-dependent oxidoreductase [Candidatus Nitrosotalea sp.]|nr:LLM class flavin-dependent oxidoreductase [Candidatus Nitrosotalea sp.]